MSNLATARTGLTVHDHHDHSAAIVDHVLRAAHRLRTILDAHFAEFDLSEVRVAVLKFIRDSEPYGCTQAELAQQLNQSESSISTLIDRMRKSGLLFRLRSKTDRRKRSLMPTERGKRLLLQVEQQHDERMGRLLQKFERSETLLLATLLKQLVSELEQLRETDSETAESVASPIHQFPAPALSIENSHRPVA